jgi:hypothetical protein
VGARRPNLLVWDELRAVTYSGSAVGTSELWHLPYTLAASTLEQLETVPSSAPWPHGEDRSTP